MVFSGTVFLLVFLPVTLLIYYILPHRARNAFLFAASLVFYAWGEPVYILIMLFSTVFDFANGLLLERFEKKNNQGARKFILALSVVVNLGLLCFFKYTNFAIESINSFTNAGIAALNVALPVGISFYTFQTLSYTIDVYRKKVKANHNILDFGMYISMFPQLIAGPIVRYASIEKQIKDRKTEADKILRGIFRFTVGLGKKVIIANNVGALWEEISALENPASATALIGAIAFALQIYFDFSGYSDMAIGLGKMLGFDIPENFDYPYESKSVTEFWRRWHISLGTWFREYLYIPLGGNRKGLPRQIINLLVVWFLTGLWHGAGWNFIIWGLYFFVLLVIEKLFLLRLLDKCPKIIARVYTLFAVLISWVIFASDSLSSALGYLGALFGKNGFANGETLYFMKSYEIILVIGIIGSVSLVKRLAEKADKPPLRIILAAALYIISLILIVNGSYNPFLYFRF